MRSDARIPDQEPECLPLRGFVHAIGSVVGNAPGRFTIPVDVWPVDSTDDVRLVDKGGCLHPWTITAQVLVADMDLVLDALREGSILELPAGTWWKVP